jgi:succinoglycan biosynthesis protein ExoA
VAAPRVSVITPCRDEQATIEPLLAALAAQTYPLDAFEVIIADGRSTDGTLAAIERFRRRCPALHVRVIDNPQRTIPAGLNRALAAAAGDVIVRMDAHAAPHPEYIARCVAALECGVGANVGGVWQIRPGADTLMARAIAAAAAHPLAVGDARYRYARNPGPVDTVPFGAFRRELVARVGPFDETLLANEDYEFNVRVRQAGGTIWLDPAIRAEYVARPTLGALARQYWRYGYWKQRMLRRYPATLRWRQAGPPAFVASLGALLLASPFARPARVLLAALLFCYTVVLGAVSAVSTARRGEPLLAPFMLLAIGTMHLAWGAGFLWSMGKP